MNVSVFVYAGDRLNFPRTHNGETTSTSSGGSGYNPNGSSGSCSDGNGNGNSKDSSHSVPGKISSMILKFVLACPVE